MEVSKEHNVLAVQSRPDRERIQIAVCHRDPLLRLGLLAALRQERRFDPQQIASTEELLRWRASVREGSVALCDYDAGTNVAERSGVFDGRVQVMVVTHRQREADVQGALSRGVQGYLLVGCRLREMVEGVFALARGQRFLCSTAAQRVADRICYDVLTPREEEVLRYVTEGWSNKMVAARLGVTEGTVKSHVKAILGKLSVSSRTEAATVALRRGLVVPNAHEASS